MASTAITRRTRPNSIVRGPPMSRPKWRAGWPSRRRAAHVAKTVEAYRARRPAISRVPGRTSRRRANLVELAKLAPQDVRAFMAARRADGIGGRSLMRALAGVRSFARFLERNGKGKVGALAAVRAPKVAEDLAEADGGQLGQAQSTDADISGRRGARAMDAGRDAAVLALLYGSGLRISEALGLHAATCPHRAGATPSPSPAKATSSAWCRCCRRCSQLIADYISLCPYDLPDRRPAVRRRARRAAIAAHHPTGHGAAARRTGTARHARRRTRCGIRSPRIFWRAAATCARSRNCSATPRSRRRKSIRLLTPIVCSKSIAARIRGRDRLSPRMVSPMD